MSDQSLAARGQADAHRITRLDEANVPRGVARLLEHIQGRVARGRLDLHLPGGLHFVFEGPEPGSRASLTVHRWRTARRFALGGSLGFAEAYLDGDWDSADVTSLLRFFLENEAALAVGGSWWRRFAVHVLHRLRANTKAGSRRNIAFHYDLGNSFYESWLDRSMTYSSAVFATDETSLEAAQRRKYGLLADAIDLKPGQRVLEIGCGWGGFAEYAAVERGAEVVGLTISAEQARYAQARLAAAGVADRTEIRLEDYRDATGRYDAIVSIEMIEAVGEAYWPTYFQTIRDRLVPGGKAALQAILIADDRFARYRRGADFIQRHIFPGGMLPCPRALREAAQTAGLGWRRDVGYALDYARTLKDWRHRFVAAWPKIKTLGFDDRFHRVWTYYLAYCEAGFAAGTIDLRQILLARD